VRRLRGGFPRPRWRRHLRPRLRPRQPELCPHPARLHHPIHLERRGRDLPRLESAGAPSSRRP